ncbi:MAG: zeta toxin family protein [Chloroflexi bacterium]|nr:zeta toxin family protein [Chloroflexota bacterium]
MTGLKPKLIVIAGPNGSGKTSVTNKILQHDWMLGCVYVNPDNIARDIFGDWNSPDAVLKAANLAAQMREDCLSKKESLLFETVLSAPDKLDFIRRAKTAGYFIRLFFVGTDSPTINASRIARRVMEGGHDVPIAKIVSRYTKSIANCAIAASMADRTYIYDNSVDYADPTLLFRVNDGKLGKVYGEVNDWADEILKTIEDLH